MQPVKITVTLWLCVHRMELGFSPTLNPADKGVGISEILNKPVRQHSEPQHVGPKYLS